MAHFASSAFLNPYAAPPKLFATRVDVGTILCCPVHWYFKRHSLDAQTEAEKAMANNFSDNREKKRVANESIVVQGKETSTTIIAK